MIRLISIIMILAAGASAQIAPDDIIADFESGNITDIQQVGIDSFTVRIRLDDNHGDTYGWYYFAIVDNQGRTATIFLTNPDGWQNSDCRPVVSGDNIHWGRVSETWGQNGWLCFRQFLNADTVWFAQGFPYTLTRMYAFLDSMENSPFVTRITLGNSVHNRPIDMVTITDERMPLARKRTAWLISRQHCMESPSTFMLTGLMDRVLQDDSFAGYFRRDINLKIVPIVNVDGVVEGYSRHNVNGINLNRDWRPDMENEQPEVRTVHSAIDNYLSEGNGIDLFLDSHAAPDNYDFGYRMSLNYTSEPYYGNQETFLRLYETFDQWQDRSQWRDLDTSYAFGVSCVVLYDMYSLDAFSAEIPWTRRENNDFITVQTLYDQGAPLAQSIYSYLYPLTVCDENEIRIDSIVPGQTFMPIVSDFDQRNHGFVEITALCSETADSEQVTCYRRDFEGIFAPFDPVPTTTDPAFPGDGIVSLVPGAEMIVLYAEPEMPERVCRRFIAVEPILDIAGDHPSLPRIELSAYPNPFNSLTTISYSGLSAGQIRIFDIMGREIRKFDVQGDGAIAWNAKDNSGNDIVSGIYFVALDSHQASAIKLVYLK